jgi:ASCH domain
MLALSIRQPHAEMILLGVKTIEFRSHRTHTRGRIYIYASLHRGPAAEDVDLAPGIDLQSLPRGKIVGTVEVCGCDYDGDGFEWQLRAPRRLKRPKRPIRRANPVFFRPW